MPAITIQRRHESSSMHQIAITTSIIAGTIFLVIIFVVALTAWSKRQQYQRARTREPQLSWKEFQRRLKLTPVDRMDEEELQRCVMIRKSLASRSFGSSSRADSASISSREGEHVGLREDWKEWEARMMRERSDSAERHPASMPSSSVITVPEPARSRSPHRSPIRTYR